MEQWTAPDCGTTRISNPKTLQRWIDLGWYKELIDQGYIFAPHCGRFRSKPCTCSACRNKRPNKDELIKLLNNKQNEINKNYVSCNSFINHYMVKPWPIVLYLI